MRKRIGLCVFLLLLLSVIGVNAWAVTPKFASYGYGEYGVAVKSDGTLWQWRYGITTPTRVGSENDWIDVECGDGHFLALKSNGTVWAWGSNAFGQLGDDTQTDRDSPVLVLGIHQPVIAIAAGGAQSMALTSEGNVIQWGATDWEVTCPGDTGCGLYVSVFTGKPVSVSISGVNTIAAGSTFKFAIKSDGSLWTWGKTMHGALGIGGDSPVQFASQPTSVNGGYWGTVTAGSGHALGLKTDGGLWGWGSNESGQVGNGLVGTWGEYDQLIPVKIDDYGNNWNSIGARYAGSRGLLKNGTICSWGNAIAASPPSPTCLSEWGTDWIAISKDGSLGYKADGTLWYLEPNPTQNPVYIMTLNSTVFTAWQDDVMGNNEIWVKSSTDGGATWGNAVRLTDNAGNSQNPALARSGANVYVVWQDDVTGNNEIWLRSSSDGGATWGSAVRLTNNTGNSVAPDLKVSGNTLYVAWQDDVTGNNEIWVKSSTDGGATWGNAVRLSYNSGTYAAAAPVLAVNGSSVYVAWQDDLTGNNEIWLRSSSDGGATWGSAVRLTNNTGNSVAPDLKVSGNTLYVAWQDDVMGNNEIWVKSSSDGGATWGNAVRLTDNAGNSAAPVLGVSGNTVYVAWQDDVMGNNEIWLRSSPDGGATWGSEIRLTDNAGNSQAPVLAN